MAVTDANIYTSVWSEVRTLLVAANLVVTNSTTSQTTLASVNASFNDKNLSKPQVVIQPIDKDEAAFKFGSYEGKKMINVFVDCYASQSQQIDSLAEQVESYLKLNIINGVELVGITCNNGVSINNDSKYFLKSITLSYDRE